MQQSFTNNYILIYFFQILSIALGFASMFIVTPALSSNPTVYGIYFICTSITIFFSYADFGFLGAGMKFAAEYYAKNERRKELEMIGFSHFILLITVLIICLGFLILSFNPSWLIKDIPSEIEKDIAQKLLLILAIFSPTIVLQRMIQMIYNIRLQEYKILRISIIGNIVRILSVFFFFNSEKYDIVGFYFTFNVINLLVVIFNLAQANRNFHIKISEIFANLRFKRVIFHQIKHLAFSTIIGTLLWIIFYELDSIVIGRTLGPEAVAMYAIGLTLLGFIRSMLGVFFSPFAARFNHFIGLGKEEELRHFYLFIIEIMFFIVVLPLLSIALMAKPITISWVGEQYIESIPIVVMLVLCNILAFIQYPTSNLIIAKQQMNAIYITNGVLPLVYWVGIIATIQFLGIYSFPIFKLIAFIVTGFIYIYYTVKFLEITIWNFIKKIILPYLPAISFTICILTAVSKLISIERSSKDLLLCGSIIFATIIISFIISLYTVKPLKEYAIIFWRKISIFNK